MAERLVGPRDDSMAPPQHFRALRQGSRATSHEHARQQRLDRSRHVARRRTNEPPRALLELPRIAHGERTAVVRALVDATSRTWRARRREPRSRAMSGAVLPLERLELVE